MMKKYNVTTDFRIEIEVKANSQEEAIQRIEEELSKDYTLIFDNLGYDVEEIKE